MKYFTLFFLSLVFSNGHTQPYLPTLDMNPAWAMTYQTMNFSEDYYIQLEKDTLLCGHLWTAVKNMSENQFIKGRIGYFREEGDKVFVRTTSDCSDDEYLMYDYSAEIGDTVWCGLNIGSPQLFLAPVVVGGVSSVSINRTSRKTIGAIYKPDPISFPIQFLWIEGVGDLTHPFYSLACGSHFCTESDYSFYCLYLNGNLSFSNTFNPPETCAPLIDTIFVNQNLSSGNNNGLDWNNAFFDLQSALSIADSSDIILVAKGTYVPTDNLDRTISFVIPNGVKLFGGFMGNESQFEERNILENPTILSGDIGTLSDKTDNTYHILYALGVDSTTLIDGFIIENGNADANPLSNLNARGGGLLIHTDDQRLDANPTINNCIFRNNCAGFGGAIYCNGNIGYPALQNMSNVLFEKNAAARNGGGIFKQGGITTPYASMLDCSFIENTAHTGGGVFITKTVGGQAIHDCLFFKDTSLFEGGGMFIESSGVDYKLDIRNTTFQDNFSYAGGAISIVNVGDTNADSICLFIESSLFKNNIGFLSGGGALLISHLEGFSLTSINTTAFDGNECRNGGSGIFIQTEGDSYLSVQNSIFSNNLVINGNGIGGIYYVGSGDGSFSFSNKTTISNSIFHENSDALGFITGIQGNIDLNVNNCTFYHNGTRPFIKNWDANFDTINYFNKFQISNSIIWENTPVEFLFFNNDFNNLTIHDYVINNCLVSVPDCNVNGVDACIEGMIYLQNPLFQDTLHDDFRLRGCSPAINVGNNSFLNANNVSDFDRGTRILENIVDMGAFERNSFSIAVEEIIDATCKGVLDGEVVLNVQGNAPFNYSWEKDILSGSELTNLGSGNYAIVVTDSLECTDTISVEIGTEYQLTVFASIQNASTFSSNDGAIFIDSIGGGDAPFSFVWETGDTTSSIDTLEVGFYNLIVIDANGCQKETEFEVSATDSNASREESEQIQVYPNPANDLLILQVTNKFLWNSLEVRLLDPTGRIIIEQKEQIQNSEIIIDTVKIPSGVYFLQIVAPLGKVFFKKILIVH